MKPYRPASTAAGEGPLELWVLPLRRLAADYDLLDARERSRADRLAVAHKQRQFIAAQGGLRRVLGTYLDAEPSTIEFAYGPWGKPRLPANPRLAFNLTHSGDLALVALGEGTEIGVDLEYARRERPFRRLARRYFAAAEQRWIESLGEDHVRAGFYRTWTLKEAYLKAIGTGLSVAPEHFELDLEATPSRLLAPAPGFEDAGPWTFTEPWISTDYAAALCWRGEERHLLVHGSSDRLPAALS